jgi:DNA-binding NtrC family response regulator
LGYSILIIDDEENARKNICGLLKENDFDVIESGSIKIGRDYLMKGDGDVVLLDVHLPDGEGTEFLKEIVKMPARPPVILITGYGDIEMAVEAMKNGAHDFITKPIVDFDNLIASIKRAIETVQMRRELNHLRQSQNNLADFVIGKTQQFALIIEQAKKAAKASVSVLITGETGSGKEVLARFIHKNGSRSHKPFVAINCAAIQSTVLESELFGYEAGAFTGAEKRKHGLMEIADEGILFLDEISSMPTDIQAKLLRAIEEHAFRRVGGIAEINVNVQVLAASNRNLAEMIADNKFREDLYYRLKVVDLHVPPLRERKIDIPELTGFLVKRFNQKMGMNVVDITQDAMEALTAYHWPGNIRELSNAVERAMLFCDGEKISLADLPLDISKKS